MTLEVTTGVTVTNISGPLDYGGRSYIIDAEGWNMPAVESDNMSVSPVRARTGDEFTVASINLARFFDTTNDVGVSDVALTPEAFEMRLAKASLAIREVMLSPDIIGVQEVENLATLQVLADRVFVDGSVRYDAYLMEGHDIGGIDVGFLVRRDKVAVAGPPEQVGYDTLFTDGSYLNDRPSLVLHVAILNPPYEPYPVTVVVNHLRSLSDIETTARVREKRLAQALELAQFLQDLQADGRNVVSTGDYNAFDFNDGYVDVMGLLKGDPAAEGEVALHAPSPVTPWLFNLVDLAPAGERYSFVFGGNAQELDHILASSTVSPTGIRLRPNERRLPREFPRGRYAPGTAVGSRPRGRLLRAAGHRHDAACHHGGDSQPIDHVGAESQDGAGDDLGVGHRRLRPDADLLYHQRERQRRSVRRRLADLRHADVESARGTARPGRRSDVHDRRGLR